MKFVFLRDKLSPFVHFIGLNLINFYSKGLKFLDFPLRKN